MPVIVAAQPKGGAGKTTSVVILATELAQRGAAVTIIDADRNKPVVGWAALPGCPANVTVIGCLKEDEIIDEIENAAARTPFVFVDLEGTASVMTSFAISRADLVIIPMQGSQLDAGPGNAAVRQVKQQERAFNLKIPVRILLTRTNPKITAKEMAHIKKGIRDNGLPSFEKQLDERAAFKSIFSYGGTLATLDKKDVNGLAAARINASELAAEVAELLRSGAQNEAAVVARVG